MITYTASITMFQFENVPQFSLSMCKVFTVDFLPGLNQIGSKLVKKILVKAENEKKMYLIDGTALFS